MSTTTRPCCWLCGLAGPGQPDPTMGGRHLCRGCWPLQPRSSSRQARAAACLAAALGYRHPTPQEDAGLTTTAAALGIVAWHDSGQLPGLQRFGHLSPATLAAARTRLRHQDQQQQAHRLAADRQQPTPTIQHVNATGATTLTGWWSGAKWGAPAA